MRPAPVIPPVRATKGIAIEPVRIQSVNAVEMIEPRKIVMMRPRYAGCAEPACIVMTEGSMRKMVTSMAVTKMVPRQMMRAEMMVSKMMTCKMMMRKMVAAKVMAREMVAEVAAAEAMTAKVMSAEMMCEASEMMAAKMVATKMSPAEMTAPEVASPEMTSTKVSAAKVATAAVPAMSEGESLIGRRGQRGEGKRCAKGDDSRKALLDWGSHGFRFRL
jgi:hypothetical protein